jgi:hypothetical protein
MTSSKFFATGVSGANPSISFAGKGTVTTRTPGFLPRTSTVQTSLLNIIAPRTARLLVGDDDRTLDQCAHLTPRVPYTTGTLHHVYLTLRVHVFPPLVRGYISWDYTRAHRATSLYTRLFSSSHTTCGHPPSHYVLAPHSFYNYIRIRTHHVSNQHVTVFSPDHLHAHISCCIVTVISPRNLLCALAEHPKAKFSPPRVHQLLARWFRTPCSNLQRPCNLSRSLERAPPLLPRHSELATMVLRNPCKGKEGAR